MGGKERKVAPQPKRLERQFGVMRWSGRAKETSSSIFFQGHYPASIQATLEFIDNACGYRNRDKEYPTYVAVVIDKDRVEVTDFGGIGTDASGIQNFAQVGETQEMGVSYRGGGAKFASWHLGEDLEIHAKRAGDDIEYSTRIVGFGDPNVEYEGQFAIEPKVSEWPKERGRFQIIVRRMKDSEHLPQGAPLRRVAGEVYRPILTRNPHDFKNPTGLEKREVVDANGQITKVDDKVVLRVTASKKTEQVFPLTIPLLPAYSEDLRVTKTKKGEHLGYWAGEMNTNDSKSKAVEPGIRFYYDGRLITIDYCGFDKRDPHLAGLVGEVHMDHIVGIKEQLPVNKSAGVNTDSDQWKRLVEAVHRAISPLVAELMKKPILVAAEDRPAFLERAFNEARRMADICFKEVAEEGVFLSVDDLSLLVGETHGQKPIIPRQEGVRPKREEREGKPWDKQQGRTIPGPDADPAIRRIRSSFYDRTEFVSIPDETIVTVFRDIEEGSKKTKVLQINQRSPVVQFALNEGELAFTRLVGEEIIIWMAQQYHSDLRSFLSLRDEFRVHLIKVLATTNAYRRLIAGKANP